MAELFVGAVVPILLEKLASVGVSQFLKLVKGNTLDPKTIRKWEKNLKMIGALLSDAEQRQNESNAVKLWLEDLQDLAYDLEDILDEFASKAQLHKLEEEAQRDDDDVHFAVPGCFDSAKHKVCSVCSFSHIYMHAIILVVTCKRPFVCRAFFSSEII